MIATALLASAIVSSQDQPVELYRQFKKGEKLEYEIKSHLLTEIKQIGAAFFLPRSLDINYKYSIDVKDVKNEGFADIIYRRPSMTQIDGETADSGPVTDTQNVNWQLAMTISPINEITNLTDLTEDGGVSPTLFSRLGFAAPMGGGGQISVPFVDELYRMVLFVGSLDSALDLAPKLHFTEVAPGDTWQRSVSYLPQVVKGSKDDHQVQRLDYTYTYNGLADYDGKKAHKITGVLHLDTDAAKFINQAQGTLPSQSGLEKLPMKLDTEVVFYLDEKSKHTLSARATSKGSWSIKLAGIDQPIREERISGRTSLKLLKHTP